jgi:hypothetical protein
MEGMNSSGICGDQRRETWPCIEKKNRETQRRLQSNFAFSCTVGRLSTAESDKDAASRDGAASSRKSCCRWRDRRRHGRHLCQPDPPLPRQAGFLVRYAVSLDLPSAQVTAPG